MFGCIHVIIRRHACKLNIRSQRETYITDGKHASLGICVRGNTHPWETHITVTPAFSRELLSSLIDNAPCATKGSAWAYHRIFLRRNRQICRVLIAGDEPKRGVKDLWGYVSYRTRCLCIITLCTFGILISRILENLHPNKAPGPPVYILKLCNEEIVPVLQIIFTHAEF